MIRCLRRLRLLIQLGGNDVELLSQCFGLFFDLVNRTVVQHSLQLILGISDLRLFVVGDLAFQFLQRFFGIVDQSFRSVSKINLFFSLLIFLRILFCFFYLCLDLFFRKFC